MTGLFEDYGVPKSAALSPLWLMKLVAYGLVEEDKSTRMGSLRGHGHGPLTQHSGKVVLWSTTQPWRHT